MTYPELTGLTSAEAAIRTEKGMSNKCLDVRTKSVGRILCDNIFTLFNTVNFFLAAMLAFVESYRNMLFMGVILSNIAIGSIQEIRSKRVIDRLSLISAPKAHLIRDGREITLPVSEVVTGDILTAAAGSQICADCEIIRGECEADESLVTGESDPVLKRRGDELISGSFIVSGNAAARVVRVGADSFSGRITGSAKYIKKPSSEMLKAINSIIRVVSLCIFPFGVILFLKSLEMGRTFADSVTNTAAALIGMIPEGLVLLTGIALAVSSVRLAGRHTLCQDLYCVENLARADTLCLDKTGTITEGKPELSEVIPIDGSFDCERALTAFAGAFGEVDPTLAAVSLRYGGMSSLVLLGTIPFSSARKFSAADYENFGTLALGAPNFILDSWAYQEIEPLVRVNAGRGMRVLLLAHSCGHLNEKELPRDISPKALLIFRDKLRKSAPAACEYFKKQGVTLKIISGDDPLTASNAAYRAGIANAEKYIDVSPLTEKQLEDCAVKYTVFGRVTPEKKLTLIRALKAAGHKTAMTGDGVNDVPALKEADCSIALQSGSDAARCVSQIVLLDSDLSSMPAAFEEGRRCINNIQRSAALFLVKTVFSFLLSVFFLFVPYSYPFRPVQMTLISALTIGIPSFFLALEPDRSIVKGGFLENVFKRAVPGGTAVFFGTAVLTAFEMILNIPGEKVSAMAFYVTAFVCFGVLSGVCIPFDMRRGIMYGALVIAFIAAAVNFADMFYLVELSAGDMPVLLTALSAAFICLITSRAVIKRIYSKKGGAKNKR